MDRVVRDLRNYSENIRQHGDVFVPANESEVAEIFRRATIESRHVVFRGGGMSFDTQSMCSDWVVSLEKFNMFHFDPDAGTFSVGAGVPWGAIVKKLNAVGYVPGVIVSSSHSTPGGTVSNNAHHRFSMKFGKESDWIVSFKIVTPALGTIECDRVRNSDLFRAVIGGLGWFGAVTEVTYRARKLVVTGVETWSERVFGSSAIANAMCEPLTDWDGVYGPILFSKGQMAAVVCRSRYRDKTPSEKMPPMILYQPRQWWRFFFDLAAASTPLVNRIMWWLSFNDYYRRHSRFWDSFWGYSFFFDGHTYTKRLAHRFGVRMHAFQQAYAVRPEQFEEFYVRARDAWMRLGRAPTMVDVIFSPREKELYGISAMHEFGAVIFTVTYESLWAKDTKLFQTILYELSQICKDMGGKLQFTKNVYCDPKDLEEMFASQLGPFFSTKKKFDPHGILKNEFLERLFPGRV